MALRAGLDARPDLPQHVAHRGLRDQHHRSRLRWALRRLNKSWRRPRDPPGGHDRVRPRRRGRSVQLPFALLSPTSSLYLYVYVYRRSSCQAR